MNIAATFRAIKHNLKMRYMNKWANEVGLYVVNIVEVGDDFYIRLPDGSLRKIGAAKKEEKKDQSKIILPASEGVRRGDVKIEIAR